MTPTANQLKNLGQWYKVLLLLAGILLAIVIVSRVLPGLYGLYELYWGQSSIKNLFYDDLGFSEAWSSFFAIAFSFFYALVWFPLTAWTARVLIWKFNSRQLAIAFACWIVAYGHAPLAQALLGGDVCFNQSTGKPLKWYAIRNGEVVLFDTGGYDPLSGDKKLPATPDICRTFQKQHAGSQAGPTSQASNAGSPKQPNVPPKPLVILPNEPLPPDNNLGSGVQSKAQSSSQLGDPWK